METVKAGKINLFCQPNAILSFAEYIHNYGDDALQVQGWRFIQEEVDKIPFETTKNRLLNNLEQVKKGHKDLYD